MAAPGTLQELARTHVEVLGKGTGGNTKFECIHCRKQFTGSLTRQLAYLTGIVKFVKSELCLLDTI